jgi:hypothetical protein
MGEERVGEDPFLLLFCSKPRDARKGRAVVYKEEDGLLERKNIEGVRVAALKEKQRKKQGGKRRRWCLLNRRGASLFIQIWTVKITLF